MPDLKSINYIAHWTNEQIINKLSIQFTFYCTVNCAAILYIGLSDKWMGTLYNIAISNKYLKRTHKRFTLFLTFRFLAFTIFKVCASVNLSVKKYCIYGIHIFNPSSQTTNISNVTFQWGWYNHVIKLNYWIHFHIISKDGYLILPCKYIFFQGTETALGSVRPRTEG